MQINLNLEHKYLLACSYGPDSMALFSLLLTNGYNFAVAHVNYGLRGEESEKETEDLTQYCKKHNIAFFIKWVDGKAIKGNFQKRAREERYKFFAEIADEYKFDALLTAHHGDDVIETYLMQKNSKRETLYFGIRSEITLNNLAVVRPLLNYYKTDLVHYCNKNNVPYATDSSNLELKYTRNKIRHNFVKKMTKTEKEKVLKEINDQNKEYYLLTKNLESLIVGNVVLIADYKKLNRKEKQHLVYLLFLKEGIANWFSKGRNNLINDIILSTKKSTMIKVYNTFYLVKYEDKFEFINTQNYAPYNYIVDAPKTIKTAQFTANLCKNDVIPNISESEYPLTIASKGVNQKYNIKGYEKTINRLFIDMKMPRHYRLIWPIVSNKDGKVIYVPRYRANYVPKETDLFKINIK
ncbi:MAG: tRNA(Ile)-lysidine synthase [Tenericutes bacterium ADurb.Bin087]|nr:MAG: tRNA(Ile)-lysidine synthase [Tenericutes bacterium ADurb.Bin087]